MPVFPGAQNGTAEEKLKDPSAEIAAGENLPDPGTKSSHHISLQTSCRTGNICNHGMITKIDIYKEGEKHSGLTKLMFQTMQGIVKQYGQSHLASLLLRIFRAFDAEVDRVEMGCVKFVLQVKSREGLEKLWKMYSSGELSQKLTEILVTDELVPGDKTGIAIQPTIQKSDYEQALKFFDDLETPPEEAARDEGEQSRQEGIASLEQQGLAQGQVVDPDNPQGQTAAGAEDAGASCSGAEGVSR